MRRQFVLDPRTEQLLEELAVARAGNRSYVVREAILLYAALDSALDEMEANPRFQQMMERSAADIRAGRVHAHADVKKRLLRKKRSR